MVLLGGVYLLYQITKKTKNMAQLSVKTYSGNEVFVNAKKYRNLIKAFCKKGLKPNTQNPTNEQTVKYLRAKSNSIQHCLHNADLYSIKVVNNQFFVI